jgi:hypothetical protein
MLLATMHAYLHVRREMNTFVLVPTGSGALITTALQQCTSCSFLDYDWSDGDVVFANSTCFTEQLMVSLALQGESLKPGAFLITFTKGLDSKAFKVCSAHICIQFKLLNR